MSAVIDARLRELPGRLALEWPGGRAGAAAAAVRLKLYDSRVLLNLARGQIGHLADAYVRGSLDIEGRLQDVMSVAAELVGDPVRQGRRALSPDWLHGLRSRLRHRQPRDAAAVRSHYDLCDEFFGLWLDPRRVYSCAYYRAAGMSLAEAQEAKLAHVCAKLQLQPGMKLLDVGAGWGALLIWAAERHGVRGLGITLSRQQHAYVNRLIDARGLRGQVEMRLMDYRALPESERFERIASIGMFEHVGHGQLPSYFAKLARLLQPGGLILNHGITAGGIDNRQLGAGIGDYIENHIFPGGELSHVSHVCASLARGGLELLDAENLRPHYARTLWAWSDALEAQLERARALTDEARVRAYRMYLAGSAMSFELGWLSLHQLLAAKPDGEIKGRGLRGAQSDYPFTRAHIYAGERSM